MDFSILTNDFVDDELKQLALKIKSGQIFASWMVNGMDKDQLAMIFIPLSQNPLKPVKFSYSGIEGEDVVHVFQYMKESFFTKPNNYPSFKTCYGLKQRYVKPLMEELSKLDQ